MGVRIILAVCFVPIAFIMFGILYYGGKRKGNILFGVTLWPGAEEESGVQETQRRFRRQMWAWLWGCLGLYAVCCLPGYSSVSLSLQMLWLMLVCVIFFVPHFSANRQMKESKREWMRQQPSEVGIDPKRNGEHVRIDVTTAAQTLPRPFWKAGFAGALLGFVPVIGELFLSGESFYGWWTELTLTSMAAGGLVLLWVMWHFWRMRTDVVSWRSEVNQQVARVRQYQWGRFWCLAVWENSVVLFVLWYGMHRPRQLFWIVIGGCLVFTLVLLVQAAFTERNIRRAYEKYADENYWDPGEDAHWLGGIFYYNKNDNRFMVNQRVGIGTTVNLAKISGKIFTIGAGILTAALILWAAILLPAYDFVPVSLAVEEEYVVSRQFGEEYRIPLEDIREVELLSELPPMSKRVGTATETIYKGRFMGKDYSSCRVCVRIDEPPVVKIVTTDGTIYYLNDEEGEGTQAVYERLSMAASY